MSRTERILNAKNNLNHWLAVRNGYEPNEFEIPNSSLDTMIEHFNIVLDILESTEELINTTLN